MLQITGTIRLHEVQAGLHGMLRQAESTAARSFFESVRKPAQQDLREHQKERKGEVGAWPALDPATMRNRQLARARRKGRKPGRRRRAPGIARMLGVVPQAWKAFVSEDGLLLRNMVRWAGVHDEGGRAGKGATMPRRQFVYFGRDFLEDVLAVWHEHVLKGWRR
jgi:hypothetical protein